MRVRGEERLPIASKLPCSGRGLVYARGFASFAQAGEFDVVLGMDWLTKYYATIDCKSRTVTFREPGQTEIVFRGCRSSLFVMTISSSRARQLISRDGIAYLTSVVLRGIDDTPRIEDIPVVWEFQDVLPAELLRMPPDREIEFVVDLVPGTTPISKGPYRIAPAELKELRAQLQDFEVGERLALGPDVLQETEDKVRSARERLLTAQSRQRGYADRRRRDLEFQVGDHVFLKVSPTRGIRRFRIREKLSPRFIGPYEILERVGSVAYCLALPPNLSDVHNVFYVSVLWKYIFDPAHVLDATPLELREDLSFEEQPVRILACEVRKLRNRDIPYVKVLWRNHGERKTTWELESALQERYPISFR
uniref:Tf2-1-like SH3-like domain-containing protein n=1 Tax=Ananas comosus var. bracteatus TaxID=296719 RepID=A0A6V7PZT5_ANACO|nr:unnamed protein product [Ananas comosus var. bracteatus]